MGYMQSEWVVGPALTPDRLAWLKHVLTQYGVSRAGAEQFSGSQAVTDPSDRKLLLDVLNRVVVTESHRPRGFRGKG